MSLHILNNTYRQGTPMFLGMMTVDTRGLICAYMSLDILVVHWEGNIAILTNDEVKVPKTYVLVNYNDVEPYLELVPIFFFFKFLCFSIAFHTRVELLKRNIFQWPRASSLVSLIGRLLSHRKSNTSTSSKEECPSIKGGPLPVIIQ